MRDCRKMSPIRQTRSDVWAQAEQYAQARISVIPLRLDGSKAPAIPTWSPYRDRIATDYEIEGWFLDDDHGIGIVCGAVKICTEISPPDPGIEVIDFDAGELFEPWYEMVSDIVDRLPVVATPSGGWHVLFRCYEIGGNCKIAVDPNRTKRTLIETRGHGGYVVGVGSPGTAHPTGRPYRLNSGPPVHQMPIIKPEERRRLWQAARTFNRDDTLEKQARKKIEREQRPRVAGSAVPILNAFNEPPRITWILEAKGWTTRDGIKWTRPEKECGTSAKIIQSIDGTELFYCFSSTPGLPMRSMNAFELFKHLFCGGDARIAYREAVRIVRSEDAAPSK